MDTPRNEILPNPYAPAKAEYEFIGKLIGKAVYEGINIEQKFAEPFLNLLIGRQNTFEDLQYIDPDIYRSLLALKHSEDDISAL
jgi:ubiquitin-protein ligase E3 C